MNSKTSMFRAHGLGELISALPTLFGFTPKDSLVGITLNGEQGRVGFRLRMDLPQPDLISVAAAVAARHLLRHKPDGIVVIVLTDDHLLADILLPVLLDELAAHPYVAAAHASQGRYWSTEPDCPDEGLRYDDSGAHESIVAAIASGQTILPDREALVARFAPVAGDLKVRVLAAVAELAGAYPHGDLDASDLHRIALDGKTLTAYECAKLAVWISRDDVCRDVLTAMTADSASEHLRVWTAVAQHVVEPHESAVLSVAALAAWLAGDGAQSLIAAERARVCDPECAWARLLLGLLESGTPPPYRLEL